MTKAVLLDFYGTLAVAVPGSQPPFEELLTRRGYEPAPWSWGWDLDIDHSAHSADEAAYAAYVRGGHRRLLEACGVGPDDMEHLLDDVADWTQGFTMAAYPDAKDALQGLRERGLRLAICSNWGWDLSSFVSQAGLAGLVDVEVTSARIGWRKPRPEIYAHTLERLGVDPHDAVFVGDTWDADVEGPLAFGMRPVHLCRDDFSGEPPSLPPGVARISSLAELETLLDAPGVENPTP